MQKADTIVIVLMICAWGSILLLALRSWAKEIIRRIEVGRLGR